MQVFIIDKSFFNMLAKPAATLADTISKHLVAGEIVEVEDSSRSLDERLGYTIQVVGDAGHVFDGRGRPLGIFADLNALVDHAEATTG